MCYQSTELRDMFFRVQPPIWTRKEPRAGANVLLEDRICRYASQRAMKGVLPRVQLVMACKATVTVRIVAGMDAYFPTETEEPLTCAACISALAAPRVPAAGSRSRT